MRSILLHAYHKPFKGGFVGVDIFFVIWLLDHKSAAQRAEAGRPHFDIWFLRETRPTDSACLNPSGTDHVVRHV